MRALLGESKRLVMRIRVTINITMTLTRRLHVRQEGDSWIWANFRYERLPKFCFLCKILGHVDHFCNSNLHSGIWIREKSYGSWLRADTRRAGSHPGSRWLISSSNKPQDKMDERVDSDKVTNEHESYMIEGILSKGKEIATT
ncbi:unnamed protein product [Cuscuta europaea]|uniref:Zinc knuckle CX2CX4HX4C domain-containing protein n=1 Tax=Cuscuta europaea TaxID=41803 RepID=A0A9P0ZN92_CUSEU|nr:unnamed protein product [Cuscuta europaea]